jgi:acyl-CoA thioesterase-2
MDAAPHDSAVDKLVELLDLEELDDNLFRSLKQEEGWKRVYGGQVLGQALVAATRTVDPERKAHSLHAYFILPGDPDAPILYQVERARDGRSFATRRVVAIQHGRPIFNLSASFHVEEPGFAHQAPMPVVPSPDGLLSDRELLERHADLLPADRRAFLLRPRAFELRPVEPYATATVAPHPPRQHAWLRVPTRLPDDPALHRCYLAFISDMFLVATATLPMPISLHDPRLMMASLDHAMWFHGDARVDEWLLYAMESPWAGGARGLARGLVYTRDGRLVATVAQEGLIRMSRDGGGE